jgi:hypothetical protein
MDPTFENWKLMNSLSVLMELRDEYNSFKTKYEKDVLIAYIKELLKDAKPDYILDKINFITKSQS